MPKTRTAPREADYRRLARFRVALRKFLRFSENAARRAGISPAQYQLLLFVRSFGEDSPTIRDLAEKLQILHQSAVGLVDRCEQAGLVHRRRDSEDRRRVRIELTASGRRLLERLVREHHESLAELRKALPRPLSLGLPLARPRAR